MGLQAHVEMALEADGFDLPAIGFQWTDSNAFELSTTDNETIEAVVSHLFSEVLTCGVVVERFAGLDESDIIIDQAVPLGVISEMNTHELGDLEPLEQCPVFIRHLNDNRKFQLTAIPS